MRLATIKADNNEQVHVDQQGSGRLSRVTVIIEEDAKMKTFAVIDPSHARILAAALVEAANKGGK
jgi:hypothetical protein